MVKHTGGQWRIEGDSIVGERYVATISRWSPVAAGGQYDEIEAKLRAESEANARLIAAAPELLEACQAVMHGCFGNGSHEDKVRSRDLVLSAIAKATGQ